VLPAAIDGTAPSEFVGRLSRFAFDGVGSEPVAAVGPVRVLASEELDAEAVAERLGKRREELGAEIERAERKLSNQGFVAKAPAAVIEEERGKLERYRGELAELEGD
jgi:valyl-tRNA synthetase